MKKLRILDQILIYTVNYLSAEQLWISISKIISYQLMQVGERMP